MNILQVVIVYGSVLLGVWLFVWGFRTGREHSEMEEAEKELRRIVKEKKERADPQLMYDENKAEIIASIKPEDSVVEKFFPEAKQGAEIYRTHDSV